VPKLEFTKYAYGMALWAAAELDIDIPDDTHVTIERSSRTGSIGRPFEPRISA